MLRKTFWIVTLTILTSVGAQAQERQCRIDDLVGSWKCEGRACTPGKDVARIEKRPNGEYRYYDSENREAFVEIEANKINLTSVADRTTLVGTLQSDCRLMEFQDHRQSKIIPSN